MSTPKSRRLNKYKHTGWKGYPYTPKQDLELLKIAHKDRSYNSGWGRMTDSFALILERMKTDGLFKNVSEGHPTALGLLIRFRKILRMGSDEYKRQYLKSPDTAEDNAIVSQVCIMMHACSEDIATLPSPENVAKERMKLLRKNRRLHRPHDPECPRRPGRPRIRNEARVRGPLNKPQNHRGRSNNAELTHPELESTPNPGAANNTSSHQRELSFSWSDVEFDYRTDQDLDYLLHDLDPLDPDLLPKKPATQVGRIEFREVNLNKEPPIDNPDNDDPVLDSHAVLGNQHAEGNGKRVTSPDVDDGIDARSVSDLDDSEFQAKPKRRKTNHVGGFKYEPPVRYFVREESESRLQNREEQSPIRETPGNNSSSPRIGDRTDTGGSNDLLKTSSPSQARRISGSVPNARMELERFEVERERQYRNYRLRQMQFEDRQLMREHEERKREMVIRGINSLHKAYLEAIQKLMTL